MNHLHLPQLILQGRLELNRIGWTRIILLLLLLSAGSAWIFSIPAMQAMIATRQASISKLQRQAKADPISLPEPERPIDEIRLQNFYQALGQNGYQEQQLKTIFAIAAKNGLALNAAEYKAAYDKAGRFHTYRISFPLRGSYPAIRQFCEQILEAIPFAALNEISFRRDSISNPVLEARMSFTLYLAENGTQTKLASSHPDS